MLVHIDSLKADITLSIRHLQKNFPDKIKKAMIVDLDVMPMSIELIRNRLTKETDMKEIL